MLHGKERLEFLSDLGFVFGGNGVQHLAFEMHDAELVQRRGKSRTHHIFDTAQSIGDNQIDLFHAALLERFELHFPSNCPFCRVIYHREHLATAVGQQSQHRVVGLLRDTPVTTRAAERGIDVDGQIVRGKSARKPLLDLLITSPGEPAHLLFAVVVTVDATTHLGDVFTGKSTSIQLMKKQRTLAFLSSQDAEYDRLKSPRASARNAKLKTATVSTPTTRTETVALFSFMLFEKEGTFLLGKTIQKYAHQLIKTSLT